jgi:transposase
MAALIVEGPARSLTWMPAPRTWIAEDLLHFVQHGIPRGPGPLVVTIDNAAIHRSHVVTDALPELRRQGIYFYVLPPYASELTAIEPYFGVIKHHDLSERRYRTVPASDAAVDAAFGRAETRLLLHRSQERRWPSDEVWSPSITCPIAQPAHELRPSA